MCPSHTVPVPSSATRRLRKNAVCTPQGLYHLLREGTQFTATFTSVGSDVQHTGRLALDTQFTVPVGFRSPTAVTR